MVTSRRFLDILTALIKGQDVLDSVLLTLPTLNVDCRPDSEHKKEGVVPARVENSEVFCEEVAALVLCRLILRCRVQMVAPQYQAKDGGNDKHGNVMDEEGEVHGLLFAIVARNEHDGLNMRHQLTHA